MTVALCVGALLAGCGRSEMSEVEVRARSEEIAELLLSAAEGIPRHRDDIIKSDDRREGSAWGRDARYWRIHATIGLAEDSGVRPPEVAREMERLLLEDGWAGLDRPEPTSGVDVTLAKREAGGSWTVIVGAWDRPPPWSQRVYFWVVSPTVDH
jgi:hypothetical protein